MNKTKVIHIDTAFTWRGGQHQVALLIKSLSRKHILSHLICQPNSRLHYYCKKHKLSHLTIKMNGELDVIAAIKIARLIKSTHALILHTHTAHAFSLGLLAKLLYPNIILVYTKRVAFPIQKNPFSHLKYKNSLLNKIICVSNFVRDSLLRDGIEKNKLITIPSGIQLSENFEINNEKLKINFPQDTFIVITVAAIEKGKGFDNLIEAAYLVLKNCKNVRFIALGKGKHEEELKHKVNELNISDKFIFLGFRDDVHSFLNISDLFVLVSKEEGFGSSILDAQAAGLPVIASKTGGIPQIIQNEITGILVPVDEPKILAKQIIRLQKNDKLRKNLSQAALESVKQFSIEKTIDKHISLYRKLITKFL